MIEIDHRHIEIDHRHIEIDHRHIEIDHRHIEIDHRHMTGPMLVEAFLVVSQNKPKMTQKGTSSSRSSDGNSSLPDEGGSALQVPQASVQLAGYRCVVWPDSLSEWLVGGAELQ